MQAQRSKSRRSVWGSLTRQRPHRAIDLVLGAFVLVACAAGIATFSWILAIALVALTVGFYVDGLVRQERSRRRRSHRP